MVIVVKSADGVGVRTIDTSNELAVLVFNPTEIADIVGMPAKGHDVLSVGPDAEMKAPADSAAQKWIEGARAMAVAAARMSGINAQAKEQSAAPVPIPLPAKAGGATQVSRPPTPIRPPQAKPEKKVVSQVVDAGAPTRGSQQLSDEQLIELMGKQSPKEKEDNDGQG